MVFYLKRGF